jgi:hypothetical protein
MLPERPTLPGLRELWVESVFEYGSRAGIWRLADVFDEYDVLATPARRGECAASASSSSGRFEPETSGSRHGGRSPGTGGTTWQTFEV